MSDRKTAFIKQFPRRVDIPILIVLAAGTLVAGFAMPTLNLTKVIFFTDTYSIWGGITELWKSDHVILAGVIFFFSMVFPVGKLVMLAGIWVMPMGELFRSRVLNWLAVLGKWSMLDVYVVATIVVLVKAGDLADANADIGIYLFGAAVVVTNIVSLMIKRLDKVED